MSTNTDIWDILTHPIAQASYGAIAVATQALAYAGPIISSRIISTFATCCSTTSDAVQAWACKNTPPESDARDNYCDSLDDSADNWFNCRYLVMVPPVATLAAMAARAYRIDKRRQAGESVRESEALIDSSQRPKSTCKKVMTWLTSFQGKLAGTALATAAGIASIVGSSFTRRDATWIGMSCANATISLDIWPYTGTNTSMIEREGYCQSVEKDFTNWEIATWATLAIVPLTALAMGACCIHNANKRRKLLAARHSTSIVDDQTRPT